MPMMPGACLIGLTYGVVVSAEDLHRVQILEIYGVSKSYQASLQA